MDPIADLPVRRIIDATWAQRATVIDAKVMGTVPRAWVEPFIHQRYDDMSVLGTKD